MTLDELYKIITTRKQKMPVNSYVASLFRSGKDQIIQKVGEEATEVVIAAKNGDQKRLIAEVADLVFHTLVLLTINSITLSDLYQEFGRRNTK